MNGHDGERLEALKKALVQDTKRQLTLEESAWLHDLLATATGDASAVALVLRIANA